MKSTSYAEAAALAGRGSTPPAPATPCSATPQGRLSEALTANVFVVLDGRRLTPGTDCGCLGGIVREVLLEAGARRRRADVPLDRLGEVAEAFLTSSVAGVRPIASIDGRPVPVVGGPIGRGRARRVPRRRGRRRSPPHAAGPTRGSRADRSAGVAEVDDVADA